MNDTTKRRVNGCALLVIVACLGIFAFVQFAKPTKPDNNDIKDIARMYIIKNVRDPKGIEFYHDENIYQASDSVFNYSETIKAPNGLGLKVAANVFVKLKWKGNDPDEFNNWELLDMKIDNK